MSLSRMGDHHLCPVHTLLEPPPVPLSHSAARLGSGCLRYTPRQGSPVGSLDRSPWVWGTEGGWGEEGVGCLLGQPAVEWE